MRRREILKGPYEMNKLLKKMIAGSVAFMLSAGIAQARESYSWKSFKGNLDANGIDELIQGSVFVGYFQDQNRPGIKQRDSIIVSAVDRSGKTFDCAWLDDTEGHSHNKFVTRGSTFTQANRIRLDRFGVADIGSNIENGGSIPIYNAKNGGFQTFIFHKRKWWENETGHLQKNIPAVTYELCPDFPKASSLGMGVNKKQTAKLYTELVKQHPGARILRPDLITDQTRVTWKRGEPEPPLTRGYWNAFSEHPCFGCNKGN
jgi:hypothetical protein